MGTGFSSPAPKCSTASQQNPAERLTVVLPIQRSSSDSHLSRDTKPILPGTSKGQLSQFCFGGQMDAFPTTKEQSEAIRLTWQQIGDHRKFCQNVFIQLFMHKPNLKRLFHLEAVPVDELDHNPNFTKHARNFAHFIDTLVESVSSKDQFGSLQEVKGLVCMIGEKHVILTKVVKFDTEYWHLFRDSVVDQLTLHFGSKFSSKEFKVIQDSWQVFLTWVVDNMKAAYLRKAANDQKVTE